MTRSTQLAERTASLTPAPAALLLRRKPRRVTITVSWQTYERLQQRADVEGRSTSNLSAYLLEKGLN